MIFVFESPARFRVIGLCPVFGLVNNLQTTGEQPIAKSGAI
jgi:hypothetical protein